VNRSHLPVLFADLFLSNRSHLQVLFVDLFLSNRSRSVSQVFFVRSYTVCCSVLQCIAVCCSLFCRIMHSVLQCVAVCCSVLHSVL